MIPTTELGPKIMTETWVHLLNISGCSPKNENRAKRNICYLNITCSTIIMLSVILNIVLSTSINISRFAECFIVALGFFQYTIRFITFLVKANILSRMLEITEKEFWCLDVAEDLQTKNKLKNIYVWINKVARLYTYLILISVFVICVASAFLGKRNLPMDIWIPNKEILKTTPFYEICYVLEISLMINFDLFCLVPTDALFIIFIGLVYCQFNLIKAKLNKIGARNNNYFNELTIIKSCVKHHVTLLRFLEMQESVYSNAILLIIASNLCLATLSMYAVVMETDTTRQWNFIYFYCCIFLQLYFYCQAGQIIQDEVTSVGSAVYESCWYSIPDREVRMAILNIILRSQRPFNITAGGFMALNLENFFNVYVLPGVELKCRI